MQVWLRYVLSFWSTSTFLVCHSIFKRFRLKKLTHTLKIKVLYGCTYVCSYTYQKVLIVCWYGRVREVRTTFYRSYCFEFLRCIFLYCYVYVSKLVFRIQTKSKYTRVKLYWGGLANESNEDLFDIYSLSVYQINSFVYSPSWVYPSIVLLGQNRSVYISKN